MRAFPFLLLGLIVLPLATAAPREEVRMYSLAEPFDCSGTQTHATGANRVCFDIPSGATMLEIHARDVTGFVPRLLLTFIDAEGVSTWGFVGCWNDDPVPSSARVLVVDVDIIGTCVGIANTSMPSVNAAGWVRVAFS